MRLRDWHRPGASIIKAGLDRIEFTSASLAGIESRLIPLQSICKLKPQRKAWIKAWLPQPWASARQA